METSLPGQTFGQTVQDFVEACGLKTGLCFGSLTGGFRQCVSGIDTTKTAAAVSVPRRSRFEIGGIVLGRTFVVAKMLQTAYGFLPLELIH